MLKDAKYRASKKAIPFNLTIDDFDIPHRCPVFGFVLIRGHPYRTPSLDRIIPALGYVRGNVIVISNLANRIKSDASVTQLRTVADFYETLLRNYHDR